MGSSSTKTKQKMLDLSMSLGTFEFLKFLKWSLYEAYILLVTLGNKESIGLGAQLVTSAIINMCLSSVSESVSVISRE